MRKLFRQVLDHSKDSRLERTLLLLLPFFVLVFFSALIAPGVLSLMHRGESLQLVLPANEPLEADGIAQLPEIELEALPQEVDVTEEPISDSSDTPTGWREIAGDTYYYDSDGRPVTGLQIINGKLYFFNQYGIAAKSLGVDVSQYNNFINWPAVAAQGIDYAILRAGSRGWETGNIYDDAWFERNLIAARAAGLKLGVYFYSTATTPNEAEDEALYVIECLKGAKLELPIFIDLEYSGDYPNGRSDTLSKERRALIVDAFCSAVTDNGYEAGVYSGQYYFKHNLITDYISGRYTLWLASYTSSAQMPNFPWSYDIWQFTDSGIVDGIQGGVDLNAWF